MTGLRSQLVRAADLCAANGTGILLTVDDVLTFLRRAERNDLGSVDQTDAR